MTATIRLRRGNLTKHLGSKDMSLADLAKEMGVAPSTVARIARGIQAPGERFIARLLAAFPHLDFEDLFEVVADEGRAA